MADAVRGVVVIVDDDQLLAELVAIMLRRHDFEAIVTVDAESTRSVLAARSDVDLVICDLELGRDNGAELLRELRAANPGLGALLVSGHSRAVIRDALDGDDVAFLQKPFEPSELLEMVDVRVPTGPEAGSS